MELLLFRPLEYERLYNCSGFNTSLVPLEDRIQVLHGCLLITLFVLFELLYIPCMISMYRHLDNPCYKLLFYIGITDMLVMLMNGLETGILGLVGAVFCDSPTLIFVTGSVGLSLWFAETSAELLLAINRCLELLHPDLAHHIYKGNRTWWLCVIPTIYAIALAFFFEPILFSGLYFSWFFNPYVGYVDDFGKIYHNPAHTIHDTFVIFGLSAIYITFSVMLTIRTHSFNSEHQPTLAQKMVNKKKEKPCQIPHNGTFISHPTFVCEINHSDIPASGDHKLFQRRRRRHLHLHAKCAHQRRPDHRGHLRVAVRPRHSAGHLPVPEQDHPQGLQTVSPSARGKGANAGAVPVGGQPTATVPATASTKLGREPDHPVEDHTHGPLREDQLKK